MQNRFVLYFEKDLGENKVKYFTEEIEGAKVFEDLNECYQQMIKLKKPELLRIAQIVD